ncbi:MAG TPA: ABC transporter permease [Ktedonobacterales bacterium]
MDTAITTIPNTFGATLADTIRRFAVTTKMIILTYLRARSAIVFGLVFPSLLYLLYGNIFKGATNVTGTGEGQIDAALYLMPSVITWSLVLMGISGSMQLVQLRLHGVFRILRATPMPAVQFLLALVCTQLLLVVAQVSLMVLLGAVVFNVHPTFDGWYLAVAGILGGAAVFIALGQFIALISPQIQTANIFNQVINLATTFFCNLFLRLSTMPDAIQHVGRYLPGFLVVDILRPALIVGNVATGNTWNNPLLDLAGLAVYFVALLAATTWLFRRL